MPVSIASGYHPDFYHRDNPSQSMKLLFANAGIPSEKLVLTHYQMGLMRVNTSISDKKKLKFRLEMTSSESPWCVNQLFWNNYWWSLVKEAESRPLAKKVCRSSDDDDDGMGYVAKKKRNHTFLILGGYICI